MRRLCLFLSLLGFASAARNPQLEAIHTVYLLPMSNALDQYVATQLTGLGLFQVVTDPQKADAVLTDKIGEAFEQKLDELYPADTPKKTDDADENGSDPMDKKQQRVGSFSKGRGTVFLVDRKTRNIVWSIYSPVKGSQPDDVNRRAGVIAERLRKDLSPSK